MATIMLGGIGVIVVATAIATIFIAPLVWLLDRADKK